MMEGYTDLLPGALLGGAVVLLLLIVGRFALRFFRGVGIPEDPNQAREGWVFNGESWVPLFIPPEDGKEVLRPITHDDWKALLREAGGPRSKLFTEEEWEETLDQVAARMLDASVRQKDLFTIYVNPPPAASVLGKSGREAWAQILRAELAKHPPPRGPR